MLATSTHPDTAPSRLSAPDAYCRACRRTFERPLPTPYGGICPDCLTGGNIVTLTDAPRRGARNRQHGSHAGADHPVAS